MENAMDRIKRLREEKGRYVCPHCESNLFIMLLEQGESISNVWVEDDQLEFSQLEFVPDGTKTWFCANCGEPFDLTDDEAFELIKETNP